MQSLSVITALGTKLDHEYWFSFEKFTQSYLNTVSNEKHIAIFYENFDFPKYFDYKAFEINKIKNMMRQNMLQNNPTKSFFNSKHLYMICFKFDYRFKKSMRQFNSCYQEKQQESNDFMQCIQELNENVNKVIDHTIILIDALKKK